jgi:hypothetical protein
MKNTFWGVHSGGQNVSKMPMGKVVQNDGLFDAHILVKKILNFYDPVFFKTTLDC